MNKKKSISQSIQNGESRVFLSQDCRPGPSSQPNMSSQKNTRSSISKKLELSSSQNIMLQNINTQEEMQLVSCVIRYLFVADRNKQPIQKNQIIKNALNGNRSGKQFHLIMDVVKKHLLEVFGYKLMEIESNKYILVNDVANHLPHLSFEKPSAQVLLFLVLVHIFMLSESCKEEALWDFLRKLGIIINDSFQHEYFGDIKQLVTIDFVNQRYLEKIVNKDDISQVEYAWGKRAKNEITYRSALEFVTEIYGQSSLKNWKVQYKAVIAQEQE